MMRFVRRSYYIIGNANFYRFDAPDSRKRMKEMKKLFKDERYSGRMSGPNIARLRLRNKGVFKRGSRVE